MLTLPCLSTRAAIAADAVPEDYVKLTIALASLPPGNVLSPPDLGNIFPAYTAHHVWVGQWFLTPGYADKANLYTAIAQGAGNLESLQQVIQSQRIRYLILPLARAQSLEAPLAARVEAARPFGNFALITLRLAD